MLTCNSHGSDLEKVSRSSRFLHRRTQIIIIITIIVISKVIIVLIRIQREFVCTSCKQSVLISSEWGRLAASPHAMRALTAKAEAPWMEVNRMKKQLDAKWCKELPVLEGGGGVKCLKKNTQQQQQQQHQHMVAAVNLVIRFFMGLFNSCAVIVKPLWCVCVCACMRERHRQREGWVTALDLTGFRCPAATWAVKNTSVAMATSLQMCGGNLGPSLENKKTLTTRLGRTGVTSYPTCSTCHCNVTKAELLTRCLQYLQGQCYPPRTKRLLSSRVHEKTSAAAEKLRNARRSLFRSRQSNNLAR